MAGDLTRKLDEKALSKKYGTDVSRLIRAWKRGSSDQEITGKTGIKPSTLYLIKQDIELTHRRIRLAQKKQALAQAQALEKHQIFFNPIL
ncbi:MAG: hypothetical protein A4E55_00705 [Pelotomaculum sp. PtaU1.Bin035]|nr:MAG: hypothetical protein A4E55_00705 [Pelotomaculum sp. PtaU1.Bin035]